MIYSFEDLFIVLVMDVQANSSYYNFLLQVLGSHQNVFTTKLVEGLALSQATTKILSLDEFPTGIMYHHNRDYMKRMRQKKVDPYGFHM